MNDRGRLRDGEKKSFADEGGKGWRQKSARDLAERQRER